MKIKSITIENLFNRRRGICNFSIDLLPNEHITYVLSNLVYETERSLTLKAIYDLLQRTTIHNITYSNLILHTDEGIVDRNNNCTMKVPVLLLTSEDDHWQDHAEMYFSNKDQDYELLKGMCKFNPISNGMIFNSITCESHTDKSGKITGNLTIAPNPEFPNTILSYDMLSEAAKWYIYLFNSIYEFGIKNEGGIILIDTPEFHGHPDWQRTFYPTIHEFCEKHNLQAIIATDSLGITDYKCDLNSHIIPELPDSEWDKYTVGPLIIEMF